MLALTLLLSIGESSDAWLTTKARLAILSTEGVRSGEVHIDTDYGVVTLYGKVNSAEARLAAEKAVAGLDGVKRVENMLQIVPKSVEKIVDERDENIKKAVEKKLEKTSIQVGSVDKGVVMLTGDAPDVATHAHIVQRVDAVPGVRRVESRVTVKNDSPYVNVQAGSPTLSDAWITSQVKLRLIGNEHVPSTEVHVDTWDGVVTLFGKVDSEKAKAEAYDEARKVESVVRVHNDLVVDTSIHREKVADKDIESDVKRLLAREPIKELGVDVKNGVVKLTGKVSSQGERTRAAILSRSAKGARAVRNEVLVTTREIAVP